MVDATIPGVTYVTWSGVAVVFINWLKKSPYFPWIVQEKTNLLRVIATATSLLGAAGISYTWDPHARVLAFSLPTFAGLAHFVFARWLPSFATQEIVYQATNRPAAPANVANIAGRTSAQPQTGAKA